MNPPSSDAARQGLKAAYADRGVRGAVAYLNSLTTHRFTSLYRFDGADLCNITFFDRENPGLERCADIPVEASYCVFVRDSASRFAVEDASGDERVRDHPKQATVRCYCGVPLLDPAGKMFGSICHFDLVPGRIADRDVDLLEQMAGLLRREWFT